METIRRIFWGTSDDNIVDPDTGLTGRDKKLVQSTWTIASKDPKALGITLLTRFFQCHPEYQLYFNAFNDVPINGLCDNKKFQAHAVSVISGLQNIINALDDIALLEANLQSLGERHGRRGQKPQHFLDLKKVVLDLFREALDNQFTDEVENAWIKTFDVAYLHIFKGLQRI